jgi:hypothetical protein
MMKFPVSFETSVRPGLLRLNSQFSCSPHPILMKRTFRVSAYGEDVHSTFCKSRMHQLDHSEVSRAISGSQKEMVMGVGNV